LSRNPGGLSEAESKELSKPWVITIAAIDLGLDSSMSRKLKDLAAYQAQDATLKARMDTVRLIQGLTDGRYLVRSDVLYCKESRDYTYCRPLLPHSLETDVVTYEHKSIGHLGTEKYMAHILYTELGQKSHCAL
jgi:hypothetical protein